MHPTLFSVLFGISLGVHCLQRFSDEGPNHFTDDIGPAFGLHLPPAVRLAVHALLLVSAAAFALFPACWPAWALLTASLVAVVLAYPKRMCNHLAVSLFALAAIGLLWEDWTAGGDTLRGLLQALFLLTLVAAGFHKINRGFLLPSLSFSLWLPRRYLRSRGIPMRPLPPRVARAVPWTVIAAEMLLPVGMLFASTAPVAFPLLVILMVLFGVFGAQDFSQTMLAGLALFLPPLIPLPAWGWAAVVLGAGNLGWVLASSLQNRRLALERVNVILMLGVAGYLLVQSALAAPLQVTLPALAQASWVPGSVLALFLFNAACPYLGLKQDGSMTMFSNLRPDLWDHLVIRRRLHWADARYLAIGQVQLPESPPVREWARQHVRLERLVLIGYAADLVRAFQRRFPGQPIAVTGHDLSTGQPLTLRGVPGECRWYERLCLYPVTLTGVPAERVRRPA